MKELVDLFCLVALLTLTACNLGVQQPTLEVAAPDIVTESSTAATEAPTVVIPTAVEHKTKPGEFPVEANGVVGDQDSSLTADENRASGGDRFTFTRFERPFNSEKMDVYYPFLDIQSGVLMMDDSWVYVGITVKENSSGDEANGKYGVEIDSNLDGGGDWLILAYRPIAPEWTTDGMEVWFDTNDDVGGDVPTTTDEKPIPDDGYETQVFGPETGDDPDMAWARVSPSDPNTIQLALKRDMLQGSDRFLVGLWAGAEDLDPALFELSDHFTHEQAGAAEIELEYFYPIKGVSALDNTCRMAIGFQPTGKEPGLCPLPVKPGAPPAESGGSPACPPQYVYCFNTGNQTVCICAQP